jgi:hypothetical protein
MRTVVPSLIGASKDSMAIRFLRKKDTFLFQLPAGYGSEIEKPKDLGSSNILKSASYEGRNLVSIKDYYKNDRRDHGARTQGMMA